MELWIRSQDRETLIQTKIVEIEYFGELSYTSINTRFDGRNASLGTYRTKERALEVLDEIQDLLQPQKIIKTIGNTVKMENAIHIVNPTYETITQFNTYVYEMPKE